MIHSKNIKEFFIQILRNLKQILDYEKSPESLEKDVNLLDSYITESYEFVIKLQKYSQNTVLSIFNYNKQLKMLLYRYKMFLEYKMEQEADNELKKIKSFVDEVLNIYELKRQNNRENINTRINEIVDYLRLHISLVGQNQAIKDFQRGLSLLNKNRRNSPLEAKNILLQDGIYGPKTRACFCDVCKNYTTSVIKKYIIKGIQNNVIFDTKNNSSINTKNLLNILCQNIERSK